MKTGGTRRKKNCRPILEDGFMGNKTMRNRFAEKRRKRSVTGESKKKKYSPNENGFKI